MKYTFKELIDVPKLQELTDELYIAASIPSAIIAMDGEILTGSGWQKICTDFHRKHPQIENECIKSDTNIRTKLAEGEPFAIYKCPRGLVDASSPVIIAGEHVANVFSGQVFLEPPDETTKQFFREQARKFGFDETEYMKAFKEVPIFTEKKFRAGISFLAKLAQSIADTGLTRLRELEGMEVLKKTQRLLTDTEKMGKVGGWEFNIHTEKTTWTEEIYNIHEVDLTYDPTVREAVNFYTPDSRSIIEQAVQRAIEHGEPFDVELEIMTGKGNLRIVHTIGKADLEHNRIYGSLQDVTDRKQAEETLREREEKYRSLVESTEDSIYLVDRNSTYLFMNEKHLSRLGLQPDEFLGRTYGEFHSEDDTQAFSAIVEKVFKANRPIQQEHRSLRDDNYFLRSLSPVKDPGDNTISVTVVSKDITELVRSQEALRESEEHLNAFLNNSPVGFGIWDREFRYVFINDVLQKMNGPSSEEHIGKTVQEILPKAAPTIMPLFEKILSNCESFRNIELSGEIPRTPGKITDYLVSYFPISVIDEHPQFIGGIVVDITKQKQAEKERKELEDQLHRAQRMESMGLMAGGIAHDLNNILSGIVSYPELLLMDIPVDSPMKKPMETIMESGMRAADVVTDLMTITRGVATSKEVLNFNTVVEEYLNSTEHKNLVSIRPSVTFKTQFDSDLLNTNGSPTRIKKTLMNLVINASEAIEGSGTVTISTMNQYLDEPLRGYEDVVTGEYIVLTVSDDGLGISQQDLSRIFEPFYSKKVMDRSGTGLGLAVVWNSVQDHDGYINVKSSEKGTVFDLYFPVTREAVTEAEVEVPLEDYLGHGEKILVVDDEERQREIASGILKRLGFKAEVVSSGEEAIEYVKENPVDLIVLDMVMPKGINGRKTYEEIIKIRPGQKAIIASGYAKTKEVDKAQALGAGKYIKKPYTLSKVGLAVKEELEKQAVLGLFLNADLPILQFRQMIFDPQKDISASLPSRRPEQTSPTAIHSDMKNYPQRKWPR